MLAARTPDRKYDPALDYRGLRRSNSSASAPSLSARPQPYLRQIPSLRRAQETAILSRYASTSEAHRGRALSRDRYRVRIRPAGYEGSDSRDSSQQSAD